jgi:integrase
MENKRRILFVNPSGQRKAIRLGKVSLRAAEGVKYRVEQLLECLLLKRPMDADLAAWVTDLDQRMAKKLSNVGLIPHREQQAAVTLGPFLTDYVERRTDVKPTTTRHLNEARRYLVEFFGENKPLANITPGDADDFRCDMLRRLGDNTVRRHCGRAKQFFRAAVRKRLIRENPFADMKGCGVQANRSRDYFLTREDAEKVLEACPDSQWRLIFVLSRFGGLRCPSEHLGLRWSDVNWAEGKITIQSPKTEHHEGKASRVIPLFPELLPYLNAAWEAAEPGTEFVITRYRDRKCNLRTQLVKIIQRAGLKPWPKLFHNLRATRETELAQTFPLHVVCAWIGNSQTVAAKHYLQVTEEHFRAATNGAQKAAQQAHAAGRTPSHTERATHKKSPVLPGDATGCDVVHTCSVPPIGLEPITL